MKNSNSMYDKLLGSIYHNKGDGGIVNRRES